MLLKTIENRKATKLGINPRTTSEEKLNVIRATLTTRQHKIIDGQ